VGTLAALAGGQLQLDLKLLQKLPRGHRVFVRQLDRHGVLIDRRLLDRSSSVLRTRVERPAGPPLWSIAGVICALIALGGVLQRRRLVQLIAAVRRRTRKRQTLPNWF
jgi:hypothetical protein